jgi:hypothetical protein
MTCREILLLISQNRFASSNFKCMRACLGQIFFLDARRDEWIDKGAIITGE